MSNVRSSGPVIHEEAAMPRLDTEVRARVPEVGTYVWRCPQTIVRREVEEAERWDGLS